MKIPSDIAMRAASVCASIGITDSHACKVFAAAILAERLRCAEIARTTYAKDAFRFELGTAVADRIEAAA